MIEMIANGMDLTPYLVEENLIRNSLYLSPILHKAIYTTLLYQHKDHQKLKVKTIGSELYIADENFYRYKLYTLALSQINVEQIALTYKLMTPLLNEAFQELGADGTSFHQTFLKALNVIIHLPKAQIEHPIQKVNQQYRFKTPSLSRCLLYKKLMIRMDSENAILIQKSTSYLTSA